jgi:hypothetical protein
VPKDLYFPLKRLILKDSDSKDDSKEDDNESDLDFLASDDDTLQLNKWRTKVDAHLEKTKKAPLILVIGLN